MEEDATISAVVEVDPRIIAKGKRISLKPKVRFETEKGLRENICAKLSCVVVWLVGNAVGRKELVCKVGLIVDKYEGRNEGEQLIL